VKSDESNCLMDVKRPSEIISLSIIISVLVVLIGGV
jgi:hypothetical protein